MREKRFYVTTFCNKPHCVNTGKPVNHECHVLPIAMMRAEVQGDMTKAQEALSTWGKGPIHKGLRWNDEGEVAKPTRLSLDPKACAVLRLRSRNAVNGNARGCFVVLFYGRPLAAIREDGRAEGVLADVFDEETSKVLEKNNLWINVPWAQVRAMLKEYTAKGAERRRFNIALANGAL